MSDCGHEGKGIIAERLERLFATVQPMDRAYTLREVVEGVNGQAGQTLLSVQYLSQLRNGDRRKPSHDVLLAISGWFGVPVTYFSDDEVTRRTDDELRALQLMRNAGVRTLAFRADGISAHGLELLTALVDKLRQAEGLPENNEPGEDSDGTAVRPAAGS